MTEAFRVIIVDEYAEDLARAQQLSEADQSSTVIEEAADRPWPTVIEEDA